MKMKMRSQAQPGQMQTKVRHHPWLDQLTRHSSEHLQSLFLGCLMLSCVLLACCLPELQAGLGCQL